jgi:hypothetical protein
MPEVLVTHQFEADFPSAGSYKALLGGTHLHLFPCIPSKNFQDVR